MESYLITPQHSRSTNQAQKEPVKEVSNLLTNPKKLSWNDLQGLTWTLFEERS
ncbi:MAG: hypothetical protein HRU07_03475 [Nitrosopumilus sp.]|nr:hypothetical protein [Nitrosopumilus sp.]NRA05219.1 hypothetical protein [Nitrosopumilus sp.]